MSELESILNYLETTSMEPHDDYTSEFSYKEQKVLWKYIKELQQENQELKKQLSNSHQMKNQQKEFIEWLEQNIENEEYCYLAQNPNERCRKDVFEEALSKYKEIIGGSNANISRR